MSQRALKEGRERAYSKLFPTPDPYMTDPVGWSNRKLRRFLWSKQKEILRSVVENRQTCVQSCHGPGKSFVASVAAAWWIDVHPPGEAIVVTTAPTDHQVKAILWREIARRRREANIIGRITLEGKWYRGERLVDEELIGFGRKPQDYREEAFQGIHEKYILVIVDEACGVPKNLVDSLETLMTNDFARMLLIGNPDDASSHFERLCRPGSGAHVIRIHAFQTPNFTGEYVPQDVADKLVTPLWVAERRKKWGVGSPLWQSKVMALFPEVTSDMLITPNMIRLAQEKSIAPIELGNFALDVARFGDDSTVIMRNQNGHLRTKFVGHQMPTNKTVDMATMHVAPYWINDVPIIVDDVGIGGGVVDEMKANNQHVIPFNGGVPAIDEVRYANRRAECYWGLRELFEREHIDIDPFDEDLHAQLGAIKWSPTRKGKVLIESKEDMKRRGMPSPDLADCAMMCMSLDSVYDSPLIIPIPMIAGDLKHKVW